jgi:hypothetical protein
MPSTTVQPFDFKAFAELFNASESKKYLSKMDIIQVNEAIENKNAELLSSLKDILLDERESQAKAVQAFINTKNRILSGLQVETKDIEKKQIEMPLKQAREKIEEEEKGKAEDLLNQQLK